MKSFIISTIFFVFVLFGIVCYQFIIEKKAEEITAITYEIQRSAENKDLEKFSTATDKLSDYFEEVKTWLMAFEDHDQILQMAQCIQEIKAYKNYVEEPVIMVGLNKFRYLLNYSVDSVKPTLENIF